MANDYTTSTDAFLDISEGSYSSSDFPVMASFVTTVSRLIDKEVGRWDGFFSPSTDDKTFYYDGSGEEAQDIDEFVSITSVSVSEQGVLDSTGYSLWSSSEYITHPYNASNTGKPMNRLIVDVVNGSKSAWYAFRKSVKVVGVPGYASTPPSLIVQACKTQSIRWFFRAKQGWQDTGGNDEIGKREYKGFTELDPDVRAMLKPFILELDR